MGDFNMVPCSRLETRSKIRKSSALGVLKHRSKVLKSSRGENEAEAEAESEIEVKFFSSMTEQLLTEILVRLPSDSVCRFKLVCKHWRSLLTSDYFVSRFIKHNYNRECPFTLVFQYSVHVRRKYPANIVYPIGAISNHPVLSKSIRNRPIELNIKRDFDDNFLKSQPLRVTASCHDLLLCCHFGTLYVVNLVTRCWVQVPPYPLRDELSLFLSVYLYRKAGLLCNGDGSGKYKVILLPAVVSDLIFDPCMSNTVHPPEIYASQFGVRIFSSESRQWVDITVDWYPLSLNAYLKFTPIVSHEGRLHWLNGRSLVSLDADNITNLSHSSVDLPKELSLEFPSAFGVCQGQFRVARLTYKEADGGHVLLVWDLEDYHKGVWQLAHRVVLICQPSLEKYKYQFTRVMAFHPYNRDIVFVEISNAVFQFNMRTGILETYYQLKLEIKGCFFRMLQPSSPTLLLHRGFPTPLPS